MCRLQAFNLEAEIGESVLLLAIQFAIVVWEMGEKAEAAMAMKASKEIEWRALDLGTTGLVTVMIE